MTKHKPPTKAPLQARRKPRAKAPGDAPIALLGGLTAAEFLSRYWQKKPLLVRGAFPQIGAMLSPDELAGLACEPEVESRIVKKTRRSYTLDRGPFDEATFAGLAERDWTLLVQGVNLFVDEAEALLKQFRFIPHARLDDLMISYAPPGGGVGPHFDSYDVFLIQGLGHRRWQISAQKDLTLIEGAPLRILANFEPEQQWDVGPGDLLYLPPRYAHNGVALDECTTYSVGFRAPAVNEITSHFFSWFAAQLCQEGMYTDPDLTSPAHPAEIDDAMLGKISKMIARCRWDDAQIASFLGRYLSEPKPHVSFTPPSRPLKQEAFLAAAQKRGLRLALGSLMLCRDQRFFLNGEETAVAPRDRALLLALADDRALPARFRASSEAAALLHDWYGCGWIELAPR